MGLKTDWKSAVAARRSLTPASTTSSRSTVTPSQSSTPTHKGQGSTHRATSIKRMRRQGSLELGGLNDADVTVGLGGTSGKRPKYGQMVEVQEGNSNDKDQPVSPAKKRRARTLVSEEKSLAIQTLPDFIEPHWKATFVPTMVHIIGQSAHPWSFASDKAAGANDNKRLVDLVQKLINSFFPNESYEVTGGDKIYRIVSLCSFSLKHEIVTSPWICRLIRPWSTGGHVFIHESSSSSGRNSNGDSRVHRSDRSGWWMR